MRILLVVPPFLEEGLEMEAKESIGIGYLASMLRGRGFEVDLLDADLYQLKVEETVQRICSKKYEMIGLSLLEGTIESAVEILKGLRQRGVHSHIVLGGYFPTLIPEELLMELPEVDSIIRGEGEFTLLALAESLRDGKDWKGLEGIAFRDGGGVVLNPNRVTFDLDEIPFPARDLLPEVLKRGGVAGLVASRGCFAHCSFCCINSFQKASGSPGWRGRSPERIVDEIEALIEGWHVKTVAFYDSNFIGPGKEGPLRAFAFGEEILRRGLEIDFALSTRPDQIEKDLFRFLKKAGLKEVFLGIESMSQKSLDLYRKGTTVEQNRRAMELLEELEIYYRPGFILYEPYVTLDQIRQNLAFLKELINARYCNKYHFFKGLRVYRGSPLERKLQARGILKRNGWHNTYSWQDPALARFIYLTGQLAPKMLSVMEREGALTVKGRRALDRLLGQWSIHLHEEVLALMETPSDQPDRWIDLSLRAEEKLARIERTIQLFNA